MGTDNECEHYTSRKEERRNSLFSSKEREDGYFPHDPVTNGRETFIKSFPLIGDSGPEPRVAAKEGEELMQIDM